LKHPSGYDTAGNVASSCFRDRLQDPRPNLQIAPDQRSVKVER